MKQEKIWNLLHIRKLKIEYHRNKLLNIIILIEEKEEKEKLRTKKIIKIYEKTKERNKRISN